MKIAVVGAGWAGLAAAVKATQAGHEVTVFEAARALGGRARTLLLNMPGGGSMRLDNGQHILIGAYTETLALMREVGVDVDAALLRLPLMLVFPDGGGLRLPRWPAPFDALMGIARARGWSWRDKAALLTAAIAWQRAGFACAASQTVAGLCSRLTPCVRAELIDPLCVSALNTLPEDASAAVFLRVLRDAMFGPAGGSNLLLPRTDLGALFPVAAGRWLAARNASVHVGRRVRQLVHCDGGLQLDIAKADSADSPDSPTAAQSEHALFDQVVLACAPWDAVRLLRAAPSAKATDRTDATAWCATAGALRFEAIATVYAHNESARLAAPMLALRSGPGLPAQFVFDRGQLGGPPGLLAFVVSANNAPGAELAREVLAQAAHQLGLDNLRVLRTVVERRATFACTPALERPRMRIADGLFACGDYVAGPYPATLEGAVRSAAAAVAAL